MASVFDKRKRNDQIFRLFCKFITWLSVIFLVVLFYHLTAEGMNYLSWDFLENWPSRKPERTGIKAGLWGSLWMIGLTAAVSIPIGVFSAVFIQEYGIKGRFGNFIETNISNLAGVPSIVYGLLGLTIFVRTLSLDRSLLAGSLTMALLTMPVIIVTTREAIKAVPNSIRYAGYALGAFKWQVVFGHVLPYALPGIVTGIILSLSRAIGETAPLIIIGALAYISYVPESIHDEFSVMPVQIYNWASRPQPEFHQVAATGIIVLVTMMLAMNFIAVVIRHRSSKKGRV